VHAYFHDDLMWELDKWLEKAEEVAKKIKLEESNYETA
jgi:hypothetical protein